MDKEDRKNSKVWQTNIDMAEFWVGGAIYSDGSKSEAGGVGDQRQGREGAGNTLGRMDTAHCGTKNRRG